MSGRKHVTITDDEFARLKMNEQQLRSIRDDVPEMISRLRAQSQRDLRDRLQPLERRQQALDTAIGQMGNDIRTLEQQTARRLQAQQQQFTQQMEQTAGQLRRETAQQVDQMAGQLRQETTQQVDQMASRLRQETTRQVDQMASRLRQETTQQITSLRAETNKHLTDVNNRIAAQQAAINQHNQQIGDINQRMAAQQRAAREEQERKKQMAEQWVSAANLLITHINTHHPRHQFFMPDQLEAIKAAVASAQRNIGHGVTEAAIAQAQDAHRGLNELMVQLTFAEQEWQLWHSAALEGTRELLELARENRSIKAHDEQDQPINYEFEVDHWTNGALTRFEKEIADELSRLQRDTASTTAQLQRFVEERLPRLNQQLGTIVRDARLAVLASQKRMNVADLVIEALAREGFRSEERLSTYAADDMRREFVCKADHVSGSEVVVVVAPDPNNIAQYQLELLSYDYSPLAGDVVAERIAGINQHLSAAGLSVGTPAELGGRPDPAIRDIPAIRRGTVQARQPGVQRTQNG